jgi:hypothetical protein
VIDVRATAQSLVCESRTLVSLPRAHDEDAGARLQSDQPFGPVERRTETVMASVPEAAAASAFTIYGLSPTVQHINS